MKRKTQSNNNEIDSIKNLELKNLKMLTFEIMRAGMMNKNHKIYDVNTCKRIVENINIMTHEIHTDASGEGASGIIVGRTLSASMDKKGVVSVVAEIESKVFKKKDEKDFTLATVGIGATKDCVIIDYDFSCLFVTLKSDSNYYKDGKLM